MATKQELQDVFQLLTELVEDAAVCEGLAQAHIACGEPWSHSGLAAWFKSTDHDRARDQSLQPAETARSRIRVLRSNTLSEHLVYAEAAVRDMRSCCKDCLKVNRERAAAHEPFRCMVKERFGDAAQMRFKFQVTDGGQIHESR